MTHGVYGGWEEIGDSQLAVEVPRKPKRVSSSILRRIKETRFESGRELQERLGTCRGTLIAVLNNNYRVSIKTAKKWSKALDCPEFLEAVVKEHVNDPMAVDRHYRRWATSMEIDTYKNLYNFYQKALRSGISPPGDVHHEMGKIYRRLKKAGEVG